MVSGRGVVVTTFLTNSFLGVFTDVQHCFRSAGRLFVELSNISFNILKS